MKRQMIVKMTMMMMMMMSSKGDNDHYHINDYEIMGIDYKREKGRNRAEED